MARSMLLLMMLSGCCGDGPPPAPEQPFPTAQCEDVFAAVTSNEGPVEYWRPCLYALPRDFRFDVEDVQFGEDGESAVTLPGCSTSEAPCWQVLADETCAPTSLRFQVQRTEAPASSTFTRISYLCVPN